MKRRHRNGLRFEPLEGRAMMTGVAGDFNGDGFDDLAVGAPSDNIDGNADSGSVTVIYGTPTGLSTANSRLFSLGIDAIEGDLVGSENFGAALAVGDFDGDGFDDLAIGAPGETVSGVVAGAVHILYGSTGGLKVEGDQRFHQDSSGVNGVAAVGNKFGFALATGDFDNNGRDDLAIGVPGEDVGTMNNAGAVNILYGLKSGLNGSGDQRFTQNSAGVAGVSKTDDQFGYAVAVGNFDADAFDDLAIGIIGEDVVGKNDDLKNDAGAVYVMYGRNSNGLSPEGAQTFNSALDGVQGVAVEGGNFGFALAAGDFNDDSRDELAIGAPKEYQTTAGTKFTSGAVHVFRGTEDGLGIGGDQKWDKGVAGIAETPTDTDMFGAALSVGRIDRTRTEDLVIGIPGNTINSNAGAGSIRVLFGSLDSGTTLGGLVATGTVSMNQGSATGLGTVEANDKFGTTLAIGDFNDDLQFDVAVGVPSDENDLNVKCGSVNVFYAAPPSQSATNGTLGTTGAQLFQLGLGGLPGSSDEGDQFGGAVLS
jgi:hypothetical protein